MCGARPWNGLWEVLWRQRQCCRMAPALCPLTTPVIFVAINPVKVLSHSVVSDSLQPHGLCLTLRSPVDFTAPGRLPGSSICGIPQARILELVTISFSRGSSQSRDQTWAFWIASRFFIPSEPPEKSGSQSYLCLKCPCWEWWSLFLHPSSRGA